jgi:hypothetical protein
VKNPYAAPVEQRNMQQRNGHGYRIWRYIARETFALIRDALRREAALHTAA